MKIPVRHHVRQINPARLPGRVSHALERNLRQFSGTDHYYVNWMGLRYTDGVKYLADTAGAHWLIDAIASYQPKLKDRSFQVWMLTRDETDEHKAVLNAQDGDGLDIVNQSIPYTDFPLKSVKLYVEGGTLILPSEH